MALKINPKELEALVKQAPRIRYNYFIKRIADSEEMFSIGDNEGLDMVSIKDRAAILLWSNIEYVDFYKQKRQEFSSSEPIKISIYSFEKEYGHLIENQSILLNIFPVENASGFVVTLQEFVRDLNLELSKY